MFDYCHNTSLKNEISGGDFANFLCIEIADFRVTAGTPFYSWIYTLPSRDLDTQKAFDTSGAENEF